MPESVTMEGDGSKLKGLFFKMGAALCQYSSLWLYRMVEDVLGGLSSCHGPSSGANSPVSQVPGSDGCLLWVTTLSILGLDDLLASQTSSHKIVTFGMCIRNLGFQNFFIL